MTWECVKEGENKHQLLMNNSFTEQKAVDWFLETVFGKYDNFSDPVSVFDLM